MDAHAFDDMMTRNDSFYQPKENGENKESIC